jgi:hypothetical protein
VERAYMITCGIDVDQQDAKLVQAWTEMKLVIR